MEAASRLLLLFFGLLFVDGATITHGAPRILEEAEFEYNSIADFQLRFEKCQFVKMFDDEQDDSLALKHFAVFRLCDTCDECETYGTYTMEVEDYLQYTIESQQEDFETMCENCDERCNEDGDYCSGCGKLCYQYENLEASGYLDAAEYTECQLWEPEDDGGDDANGDDQVAYYIGPRCNSGNSIAIGVFSDENCWEPVDDVDVEDLLGAELSYHLLRHTYSSEDQVCLSCMEQNDDEDDDDAADDADDVNEMCENVYDWAAKCESPTGLENGFVQVNRDEEDYENQVENEFMACTFINSLIWNSYTETGEINWMEKQDVVVRKVTKKQYISLGLLSLLFMGLVGAARFVNQKIEDLTNTSPLLANGEGTLT